MCATHHRRISALSLADNLASLFTTQQQLEESPTGIHRIGVMSVYLLLLNTKVPQNVAA